MGEKFRTGVELARTVRRAVGQDRRLLVFPLISAVVSMIFFSLLIWDAFFLSMSHNFFLVTIPILLIGSVIVEFISTYFVVALLILFKSRGSGNKMSLRKALSETKSYWVTIIEWSIIYTFLILLILFIETLFRGFGRLLFGLASSILLGISTLFVIPSILETKASAGEAIRDSMKTVKKGFKPNFSGILFLSIYLLPLTIIGMFFTFVGFAFSVLTTMNLHLTSPLLGPILETIGIVFLIFPLTLEYAYGSIFRLTLYDYIHGKSLPPWIDIEEVRAAVIHRRWVRK